MLMDFVFKLGNKCYRIVLSIYSITGGALTVLNENKIERCL